MSQDVARRRKTSQDVRRRPQHVPRFRADVTALPGPSLLERWLARYLQPLQACEGRGSQGRLGTPRGSAHECVQCVAFAGGGHQDGWSLRQRAVAASGASSQERASELRSDLRARGIVIAHGCAIIAFVSARV